MRFNIKHIIKQILLEQQQKKQDVPQFSADDAFKFLWDKEGKRPPLRWFLLNAPEKIEEEDLRTKESYINLSKTNIKKIPDGVVFENPISYNVTALNLEDCKNLRKIGKGLVVDNLNVSGCESLYYLPNNLELFQLSIKGSSIHDFPRNLRIDGHLAVGLSDPLVMKYRKEIATDIMNDDRYIFKLKHLLSQAIRDKGGKIDKSQIIILGH